jgi:hypothetical protein
MMNQTRYITGVVTIALMLGMTGCKTKSVAGENAKKSATHGAVAGGVSGFFWGLFRGDPLERAAEGAVVGGATGATMGALKGSGKDRELKKEYGEINYKGLMALVQRDYPNAQKYAAQSAADSKPEYRKASAWLSALIAGEILSENEMNPYYDKLVELDSTLKTRDAARSKLKTAERNLKQLRKQANAN